MLSVLRLCLLVLCFGLQSMVAFGQADNRVRLTKNTEGLYLSTNVNVRLPSEVQNALEKGLALIFVANCQIIRPRWYWLNKDVSNVKRNYRLSYIPLTRKWRVQVSSVEFTAGTGLVAPSNSFSTLEQALEYINRIGYWQIAQADQIDDNDAYILNFSFELDTDQLPRPLQIGLIGENAWDIKLRKTVRFTVSELK